MHGGTVAIHSDGLRQGSEFKVSLPRHVRDSVALAIELRKPDSCRILIIGDGSQTQDTLKAFLDLQGHAVTVADDARTGIGLVQKEEYDVIIRDIGLARLDGDEIIGELHSHVRNRASCFIALAQHGAQADAFRAAAAGYDHYLTKPVDVTILSTLLRPRTVAGAHGRSEGNQLR